jgi:hypothetical protein
MNDLNYQFFEEFTKLDKICVSVYQADGTGGYLEQMRGVSCVYAEDIPNWVAELERLHRYRTVYQALAQSPEALRESLCNQEDIEWVRSFGRRIMERQDPLALLHQRGYRAEEDAIQRLEDDRVCETVLHGAGPGDRYVNGPMVVWMIVIAIIITCAVCMLALPRL